MIRGTDQNGKELEFSVYGRYEDDIQIDEIYYLESEDEVTDETIDYVLDAYSDVISEEWYMNQVDAAESFADSYEDR
jgi:hypothetical protein